MALQAPDNSDATFDQTERRNRRAILETFGELGPIFQSTTWGHKRIFVYGLPRCMALLRDHGDKLRVDAVDITSLTPAGFIRKMGGIQHQNIRRCLADATKPSLLFSKIEPFRDIFDQLASDLPRKPTPTELRRFLGDLSSTFLFRLYYGVLPGSVTFESLWGLHSAMGPNGFCFNLGPVQMESARQLASHLVGLKNKGAALPGSVLSGINDGAISDVILFNLIYMVEIGRYDVGGLFLWIVKHLAEDPALQDLIGAEAPELPEGCGTLAEATVLETLRFDKTERLDRIIEESFEFGGYAFPAGMRLRLCLWESHRSCAVFERPDVFDPSRFLNRRLRRDEFAPFGLDRHSCIAATITLRIATIFVRLLSAKFPISILEDGPAVRGPYHWLPSRNLAVEFAGTSDDLSI